MAGDTILPSNPPGYGDTIGGVVLFDPPDAVIEAACAAFFDTPKMPWVECVRIAPATAAEVRTRMRLAVRAIVQASGADHAAG